MMPTYSIPIGMPVVMATNQVYAVPAVECTVYSSDTTPTLEQSNAFDFSVKNAITFTAGAATVTGMFIRATAGTPTIVLKRD